MAFVQPGMIMMPIGAQVQPVKQGGRSSVIYGSMQGEIYRSYDNMDTSLYSSSGQLPPLTGAQQQAQFSKHFGSYGNAPSGGAQGGAGAPQKPMPPKAFGVGMRVEKSSAGEFVVTKINPGGSAARDGSVQIGDVLDFVGSKSAFNLKAGELGELIKGPEGTEVVLNLKRYIPEPVSEDDFGADPQFQTLSYTVRLIRGGPMYFIGLDNKETLAHINQMKQQLLDLEAEKNRIRTTQGQTEGKTKLDEREVESIKKRYESIQAVIDKCNLQVQQEKKRKVELQMEDAQLNTDAAAAESAELRTALGKVEVQLRQVMVDLNQEHQKILSFQEQTKGQETEIHRIMYRMSQLEDASRQQGVLGQQTAQILQDKVQKEQNWMADLTAALENLRMRQGAGVLVEEDPWLQNQINSALAEAQALQVRIREMQGDNMVLQSSKQGIEQEYALREQALHQMQRLIAEQEGIAIAVQKEYVDECKRLSDLYEKVQADRRTEDASYKQVANDRQTQITRQIDLGHNRKLGVAKIQAELENRCRVGQMGLNEMLERLKDKRRDNEIVQSHLREKDDQMSEVVKNLEDMHAWFKQTHEQLMRDKQGSEASLRREQSIEQEVFAGLCRLQAQGDFLEALKVEEDVELTRLEESIQQEKQEADLVQLQVQELHEERARCAEAMQKLHDLHVYQERRHRDFADLRGRHIARLVELHQRQGNIGQILRAVDVHGMTPESVFSAARQCDLVAERALSQLEFYRQSVLERRQREGYSDQQRRQSISNLNASVTLINQSVNSALYRSADALPPASSNVAPRDAGRPPPSGPPPSLHHSMSAPLPLQAPPSAAPPPAPSTPQHAPTFSSVPSTPQQQAPPQPRTYSGVNVDGSPPKADWSLPPALGAQSQESSGQPPKAKATLGEAIAEMSQYLNKQQLEARNSRMSLQGQKPPTTSASATQAEDEDTPGLDFAANLRMMEELRGERRTSLAASASQAPEGQQRETSQTGLTRASQETPVVLSS